VLITLANLYRIFSNDKFDLDIRRSVLRSLEKRWAKQDQDVFILAVILNPWIQISAFAQDSEYRQGIKVIELACAAYKRFFQTSPNAEFESAVASYISRRDRWSDERMRLSQIKSINQTFVCSFLYKFQHSFDRFLGYYKSR
jgi:hypothetical protein